MKFRDKAALFTGCVCGLLATAPANALLITKINAGEEVVVDGDTVFRTVTVSAVPDLVGGVDVILDVDITIEFMKCSDTTAPLTTPLPSACPDNVNSANPGEIKFRLTNPAGITRTIVDLDQYSGSDPGSRVTVIFDDSAGTEASGTPDDTTSYKPLESFGAFNPYTVLGVWTLEITDSGALDPLGFAGFRLDITVADAAAPVPATALLVGIGLAGLAGFGRHRR